MEIRESRIGKDLLGFCCTGEQSNGSVSRHVNFFKMGDITIYFMLMEVIQERVGK